MAYSYLLHLLSASALFSIVYADLISNLTSQNFQVLTPGSSGYPSASAAFNRRFTFEPAAIAYPNSAQDVSTILSLCTSYNYKAVARSGGHSYIANGLGGKNGSIVVDLSNFKTVTVDSSTNIATIGTGNRLGDIALALNDHGRALPHGTCPYVGIGGHSGHGGYGFTSRKWGLTLDTITALQVVLANGTIVMVSSTNYPDLFFALRGSSSSFGIVTSIQAQTLAAPSSATVFEYTWDMSAATAASALAAFQSFVVEPNLPQEFGAEIVLGAGSSKGRVSFGITGGWYAAASQFNAVIAPLLAKLPKPSGTTITPGTYINSVQVLGGLGRLNTTSVPDSTDTFYAKSLMTPENAPMSTASMTAFMNYLANQGFGTNTDWFVEVELYGGTNSAINNVPLSSTAFGRRSSMFTIQFYTSAPGSVPPFPNAGFSLLDGMVNSIVNNNPSGWDYGAYANYIDNRLANWQTLYYSTNYPRLKSLKDQYDPHDTFSFPISIEE
ncbi:glucooligosaccharide oxidase [Gymnopilus junonius]|uniref:Glucooligosaccharide oxidase n=1 Tax=Gymnopilus junonius TaxID=109634 RepID=A0A9P5NF46_GYMJU|nr:glucooligosaccharide oxidase [Gymnopilus junonius]